MATILARPQVLRTISTSLIKPLTSTHEYSERRIQTAPVPLPTPFVPDAPTFLKLIGRNLSAHASKLSSWEALFKSTSAQLKSFGIDPPRTRRYLMRWRHKFRNGEYGIGGDLQHVEGGVAKLKLCEIPYTSSAEIGSEPGKKLLATMTKNAGYKKIILNLPEEMIERSRPEELAAELMAGTLKRPSDFKVLNGSEIRGPYVQCIRNTGGKIAVFKVQEGLWEHKRGAKVDGGERRKAEVRAKRRAAERRAARPS